MYKRDEVTPIEALTNSILYWQSEAEQAASFGYIPGRNEALAYARALKQLKQQLQSEVFMFTTKAGKEIPQGKKSLWQILMERPLSAAGQKAADEDAKIRFKFIDNGWKLEFTPKPETSPVKIFGGREVQHTPFQDYINGKGKK